jgi:hypothetical protein
MFSCELVRNFFVLFIVAGDTWILKNFCNLISCLHTDLNQNNSLFQVMYYCWYSCNFQSLNFIHAFTRIIIHFSWLCCIINWYFSLSETWQKSTVFLDRELPFFLLYFYIFSYLPSSLTLCVVRPRMRKLLKWQDTDVVCTCHSPWSSG